jgi:glutamate N-acetyltransferase/amino-acid N-acetyltransferase
VRSSFTKIDGAVTAPKGFRAASVAAGIKKPGKKDMALIVSDVPAAVAATFTTNQVKAAPVKVSMNHSRSPQGRAIVVNSGNANACTGPIGMVHARAMAAAVARRIGCAESGVMVCSTGRIGVTLPIVKVEAGIKKLLGNLSPTGGNAAAEAIMTTDTFAKRIAVRVKDGDKVIHIGAIAKGAGMIEPNMATMLCFITTDADFSRPQLQRILRTAVNGSFNRITVDGDTSTNDTVICMANGLAGAFPVATFQAALNYVCLELAKMMVHDGEGVSKFVTVNVHGARHHRDAEVAARAIANSTLVKCCWCGGDPNWGRIMDAIGYSDAKVVEEQVEIAFDGVCAVRNGIATRASAERLRAIVAQPCFTIDVRLGLGTGTCTIHTCDLTEKYVTLNKGE